MQEVLISREDFCKVHFILQQSIPEGLQITSRLQSKLYGLLCSIASSCIVTTMASVFASVGGPTSSALWDWRSRDVLW
jgi:hypothetical protein